MMVSESATVSGFILLANHRSSTYAITYDAVYSCNFTAPIATLGALRNPHEVLLHPYCTQIVGINSSPSRNHFHGKPTISLVIISQKPVVASDGYLSVLPTYQKLIKSNMPDCPS